MSATIAIPSWAIDSPEFCEFRAKLAQILSNAGREVKPMWLRGVSSGVYIRSDEVISKIKLLMMQFGIKFEVKGIGAIEEPTMDCGELLFRDD